MTKKIKAYQGIIRARGQHQVSAVVGATSIKAATEILGISRSTFSHEWSETGNQHSIELATAFPGVIFASSGVVTSDLLPLNLELKIAKPFSSLDYSKLSPKSKMIGAVADVRSAMAEMGIYPKPCPELMYFFSDLYGIDHREFLDCLNPIIKEPLPNYVQRQSEALLALSKDYDAFSSFLKGFYEQSR
ncbi:hypothetical protein [Vibrio harveyi]|uniref:hypothetical protein n=1 Tax=Vibrio harveyi TaxID=669 RepID=UPI003CF709F6